MGMRSYFYALNRDGLSRLRFRPDSVETIMLGSDPGQTTGQSGFEFPVVECSIDKAWHGIHFLLTRTTDEQPLPLGFVLSGGTNVGGDLGFGPARLFSPEQVDEISTALEPFDAAFVAERFDHATLCEHEIYSTDEGREEDDREYLCESFSELRAFMRAAGDRGDGVLTTLC
ncbi:MAG: YfbM family protein [Nannocystaceae bacterium]|nr:YfbM family protein [Nannocystaceae bacterium]